MKKVVFGFVFVAFVLGGCSTPNNSDSSESVSENSSSTNDITSWNSGESYSSPFLEDSTQESSGAQDIIDSSVYGLDEEAILTDNNNQNLYSLKIIKATTNLSETSESYTDGKPENTIEVTYEYKNYNMDSPMIISSQFMEAFDENGLAGKNMSMMRGQSEVSKDRSAQSTIWFVMNDSVSDKSEIEIEYVNDFSLGFDGVLKFKVPLEH